MGAGGAEALERARDRLRHDQILRGEDDAAPDRHVRDGGDRYLGKGVQKGVSAVVQTIGPALEGIAADDNLSERERLVRDMGDRPCLILRNHGLLTAGRTVAEAFYWMYYLEQACRIQVAALSAGAPLSMPPPEVVERTRAQSPDSPTQGWLLWQAMCRKLDREQPEYRS